SGESSSVWPTSRSPQSVSRICDSRLGVWRSLDQALLKHCWERSGRLALLLPRSPSAATRQTEIRRQPWTLTKPLRHQWMIRGPHSPASPTLLYYPATHCSASTYRIHGCITRRAPSSSLRQMLSSTSSLGWLPAGRLTLRRRRQSCSIGRPDRQR
ncbi:hypothetical protein LTR53_019105, partial [Teratosphaeriaceae sp. CCFEE 6253]